MRKISIRQYAQALYEATQGKDKSELKTITANFFELLKKQKKGLHKITAIETQFGNYFNQREGILEAEVITAQELSAKHRTELEDQIAKQHKDIKQVKLIAKTDERLISGLVVKIGDTVMDDSLKTRLELLKEKMS